MKEEGDICAIELCGGSMQFPPVENCSCHLNPPCSACMDNALECNRCGWRDSDRAESVTS